MRHGTTAQAMACKWDTLLSEPASTSQSKVMCLMHFLCEGQTSIEIFLKIVCNIILKSFVLCNYIE